MKMSARRFSIIALKWTGIVLSALIVFAVIWIFWLGQFFAPPPLNPHVENPVYSRSDCLVRIELEFPPNLVHKERRNLEDNLDFSFFDTFTDLRFPFASLGSEQYSLHKTYILYTQKCDQKFAMTQTMIERYKVKHPNEIKTLMSRDRIESSMETLMPNGPYWTDTRHLWKCTKQPDGETRCVER